MFPGLASREEGFAGLLELQCTLFGGLWLGGSHTEKRVNN